MLAEDNFGVGIRDKLIIEIGDSFEKLRNCDGMLFDCPIEDFEKTPKTSGNTTKIYKEESVTRGKSKSSIEVYDADYDARKLHEVCINHRLAVYFEQKIIPLLPKDEEYFVDIEFNREGSNFKEVEITEQQKTVRPDIIIHNRKSGNNKKNFLVVECKKRGTSEDKINYDMQKLEAFLTDPRYSYRFGLQVNYDKDEIKGKLLFYENGALKNIVL